MAKICVITGGASGIGRCLVEKFAESGMTVIFVDKNQEVVLKTQKAMREKVLPVEGFCGDIAEEAVLKAFSDHVISEYGKVDVLINNACLSRRGILSGCSYEDFNYVLKVGVTAPYMLASLFLNAFSEGGSIINITSTRAFMSQQDTESYTAAKGGITALTHALAVSLAGKVRVNSIAPGWIDTWEYHDDVEKTEYSRGDQEQHLSKRVGTPEDIANAALFLCDERNSFIDGHNITVDGGMTKQMIYHDDLGWSYGE